MKNKAAGGGGGGGGCKHVRDQRGKRAKLIQNFETERRNLVVDSHIDGEPVQAMKERADMIKSGATEDESSSI